METILIFLERPLEADRMRRSEALLGIKRFPKINSALVSYTVAFVLLAIVDYTCWISLKSVSRDAQGNVQTYFFLYKNCSHTRSLFFAYTLVTLLFKAIEFCSSLSYFLGVDYFTIVLLDNQVMMFYNYTIFRLM